MSESEAATGMAKFARMDPWRVGREEEEKERLALDGAAAAGGTATRPPEGEREQGSHGDGQVRPTGVRPREQAGSLACGTGGKGGEARVPRMLKERNRIGGSKPETGGGEERLTAAAATGGGVATVTRALRERNRARVPCGTHLSARVFT
jgi:hypothetical protein